MEAQLVDRLLVEAQLVVQHPVVKSAKKETMVTEMIAIIMIHQILGTQKTMMAQMMTVRPVKNVLQWKKTVK